MNNFNLKKEIYFIINDVQITFTSKKSKSDCMYYNNIITTTWAKILKPQT